jgi:hypothetical protein
MPLDKALLSPGSRILQSCYKNIKKGIDFPEKKGYNG